MYSTLGHMAEKAFPAYAGWECSFFPIVDVMGRGKGVLTRASLFGGHDETWCGIFLLGLHAHVF